ncbi:MAG TPA: hypothetical protein VF952_18265 [Chloroflexia bacterium]|jgi:hypothetical protein
MSLTAITEASEIQRSMQVAWDNLTHSAQQFPRVVGWHGGNTPVTMYWLRDIGIWTVLNPKIAGDRYWFCFGTGDPTIYEGMQSIVCEINSPHKGIDRRCAGLFAKDGDDTIYLAHSGKVGGGRKGIGKSTFVDFCSHGNWKVIKWPDGKETSALLIGPIDEPLFRQQVAWFVAEVAEFKRRVASGNKPVSLPFPEPSFTPEFSGWRTSYVLNKTIASQCNHGLVVSALREALTSQGYKVSNDRARDLFVNGPDGNMYVLFEAKTDLSSSSIYEGIGQLMFHGARQSATLRRVLVLPGIPNSATMEVLSRLNIEVLQYELGSNGPNISMPHWLAKFPSR